MNIIRLITKALDVIVAAMIRGAIVRGGGDLDALDHKAAQAKR